MRMRVWRALKDTGCAVLRDGLYVLPAGTVGSALLDSLETEIRAAGGFAMTVELKLKSAARFAEVQKLFDRSAEYGALVKKIDAAKRMLPRLGSRRARTATDRMARAFAKIAEIDFYPGQGKLQGAESLASLKRAHQESYAGDEPVFSKKKPRQISIARYKRRTWATRKDLWIDRLASAWLIKRFIDNEAKFLWLDRPRDCPKGAVGFDFDGAEFTHENNRVTFEVLLKSFSLDGGPALAAIGAAVHFLDVGGIPVADAKGLETILKGAKEKARNDDALLADALRIFDMFYSAYSPGK